MANPPIKPILVQEVSDSLGNVKLSKTDTSTSSNSAHSSNDGSTHSSHKNPLRSLLHHKKKSTSIPSIPEIPTELVPFAEFVFKTMLAHPGPSIEELRDDIFPKVFHSAYVHRVNNRETDCAGLLAVITLLRSRYRSIRVRVKSVVVDTDGTATMKAGAVGLMYEVLGIPIDAHKHEVEERKMAAMAIVKVVHGKCAQADLVIDTTPFQANAKRVECAIM